MSIIEDSVSSATAFYRRHKGQGETAEQFITGILIDFMHCADATPTVKWSDCISAARSQYQKEVREDALTRPLPVE